MDFLQRLLAVIGLSVVLGAAYLAWVALPARSPGGDGAAFASRFLADLSQSSWDVGAVSDRLVEAESASVIAHYGRLGEFQYLTDFSERSYLLTPLRGITAYAFNGRFRNGRAMVQMLVRQSEAGIEVRGLYLTPLGRIEAPDAAQVSALGAVDAAR